MPKVRMSECGLVMFHCEPCGHSHGVPTKQYPHKYPTVNGWDFNRDFENPTLSPSLLVKSVGPEPEFKPTICHLFIRNGRIDYLNDCTHAMAGKSVTMPEID